MYGKAGKFQTVSKKALIKSIKSRLEHCINPALKMLQKSVDMHTFICKTCGSLDNSPTPYNEVALFTYGVDEFTELIAFLSEHHSVKSSKSVSMHSSLSSRIFDRIKEGVVALIWGSLFPTIGAKHFEIVDGPLKGKALSELSGDSYVKELSIIES